VQPRTFFSEGSGSPMSRGKSMVNLSIHPVSRQTMVAVRSHAGVCSGPASECAHDGAHYPDYRGTGSPPMMAPTIATTPRGCENTRTSPGYVPS
jgi:hypothetical protein